MGKQNELKLYALGGFIGAIIFVLGDLLIFISPNYDMAAAVQIDWDTMGTWRFIASTWCGILGMPLLICGMYSTYKMLSEKHRQKLAGTFWVCGLIGTASTSFAHFVLGCAEPLIYKNMILQGIQLEDIKLVLENFSSLLQPPMFFVLILLDVIPTLLMIYVVLKGEIGCPKWMIVMNPIFITIFGVLLYMIPVWNGFQGVFGAFESLGEGCLYLIPLWYWNKSLKREKNYAEF